MNITYPFVEFAKEDKSKYKTATEAGYYDPDNDWLIGESGGFLPNDNFKLCHTDLLRQVALSFETNGYYINIPENTAEYEAFRLIEIKKRKQGFSAPCKDINGKVQTLRITGSHYNFLNYGRMSRLVESFDGLRRKVKKEEGFPRMFKSQYWYFKAKEFARNNNLNMITAKSRRAGISYIEAIDSANNQNIHKGILELLCAADKKYLIQGNRATALMAKKQIAFYESVTPFKRGMISWAIEDLKNGFKDKQNIEYGFQSSISSVSFANDPNVGVGKDTYSVKIDELTNSPGLQEFLTMTFDTIMTGTDQTGMINGWGTGGGKEKGVEVFEKLFYQPSSFNFMPFENIWDEEARDTVCGFFKPYIDCLEGIDKETGEYAMDNNGNPNYEVAIRLCERERIKKRKESSLSVYTGYVGQHANKPSESFSSNVDNMFASPELNEHVDQVKVNTDYKYFVDGDVINTNGQVVFRSNFHLQTQNKTTHPFVDDVPFNPEKDIRGCIRQWIPSFTVGDTIPDNLNRIWYDPIGVEKKKDDVSNKNSLGCIMVYGRPNSYGAYGRGDKLLAMYIGRTETLEEMDKIALNLSILYNAKIVVERDRGNTIPNFRQWKQLSRLAKEPTMSWDSKLEQKDSGNYGISMSHTEIKLRALSLYHNYLYRRTNINDPNSKLQLTNIHDLGSLLELQKFKFGRNLDRTSTWLIGMLDLKELETQQLKIFLKGDTNAANNLIKKGLFDKPFFANN